MNKLDKVTSYKQKFFDRSYGEELAPPSLPVHNEVLLLLSQLPLRERTVLVSEWRNVSTLIMMDYIWLSTSNLTLVLPSLAASAHNSFYPASIFSTSYLSISNWSMSCLPYIYLLLLTAKGFFHLSG